jgi:hypothetical protein
VLTLLVQHHSKLFSHFEGGDFFAFYAVITDGCVDSNGDGDIDLVEERGFTIQCIDTLSSIVPLEVELDSQKYSV